MESFTKFESENKKDRYDIFFDSTNQINEYIGLSIVHYSFDELNRIKLIEGFNSKGMRSYWDFPEIQKFRYVSDSVVTEMNQIRNEICNCINPDTLSDVVIVKEINTDPIYNKIRISIISKNSTMKLIYSICPNGKICNRSENVSYIYRQFDTSIRFLIIHERFYDADLKLINGEHMAYESETFALDPNISYAYSQRELNNGRISSIKFFNKEGEMIDEISMESQVTELLGGPIAVSKGFDRKIKRSMRKDKRKRRG
jgi:hypothetical protein